MKNRVKELRDAKHLTQTGLALKVGSTQQTISKIERDWSSKTGFSAHHGRFFQRYIRVFVLLVG